jgi:hypothetical protein
VFFLAPVLVAVTLTLTAGQNPIQDDPQEKKVEAPDATPPTPAHTGFRAMVVGLGDDIRHLPSKESLYIAGIGGALALGTHQVDRDVNARVLNQYPVVNTIFAPAKYYGDTPEQMGLSIGTWVLGRVLHMPKMSHLGMDLLRAQALTEIMVEPRDGSTASPRTRSPPTWRRRGCTTTNTISAMSSSARRSARSQDAP